VDYIRTVCLGNHLLAPPDELRKPYARAVAERCGEPLTLDYVPCASTSPLVAQPCDVFPQSGKAELSER
jgi:hypothetical protein